MSEWLAVVKCCATSTVSNSQTTGFEFLSLVTEAFGEPVMIETHVLAFNKCLCTSWLSMLARARYFKFQSWNFMSCGTWFEHALKSRRHGVMPRETWWLEWAKNDATPFHVDMTTAHVVGSHVLTHLFVCHLMSLFVSLCLFLSWFVCPWLFL